MFEDRLLDAIEEKIRVERFVKFQRELGLVEPERRIELSNNFKQVQDLVNGSEKIRNLYMELYQKMKKSLV